MALTSRRPTKKQALEQTHISTKEQNHNTTARLSVDIPEELLVEVKAYAARRRTTIKDIVIRLLEAEVGR